MLKSIITDINNKEMCCTIADHVMIIILFCYENILFQTLILHMKNFYMNVYSI